MTTTVRIAEDHEQDLVHRLDQYYLYEFSRFMPDHYKLAEDGLFHDGSYSEFWESPAKYPYLIFQGSEIAGFALVDDLGSHFLLDQFFVMLKFQGAGVAQAAAVQIFDTHRGDWQVESLMANPKSEGFWPRIIGSYTSGRFEKSVKQPRKTHH
ncbi:MAG: GNAT family N-acetyltransferase, partial [Halieaceae bacterium]